jgi:hypothetical protein
MDFKDLPWREGLGAVFSMVLLKMLWDVVYKKVPRGFRSIKILLARQEAEAIKRHAQHVDLMKEQTDAVTKLRETACRFKAARQKKKGRPPRRGGKTADE